MSPLFGPTLAQVARFGLVGVMNAFINAVIYSCLIYIGLHYILASAIGTIFGILNAFVWSKFFVFGHKGRTLPQLLRTIGVYVVQILVSWIGLVIMIEGLGMNPYLAYAANITVVTAISFLGLKYFAFRREGRTVKEAQS